MSSRGTDGQPHPSHWLSWTWGKQMKIQQILAGALCAVVLATAVVSEITRTDESSPIAEQQATAEKVEILEVPRLLVGQAPVPPTLQPGVYSLPMRPRRANSNSIAKAAPSAKASPKRIAARRTARNRQSRLIAQKPRYAPVSPRAANTKSYEITRSAVTQRTIRQATTDDAAQITSSERPGLKTKVSRLWKSIKSKIRRKSDNLD